MTEVPGTDAWYGQVAEGIIEPGRPIIDPHHHLWRGWEIPDYLLADLWRDTASGHNILKTVFIECGACYRKDGPDHLKSVGETEFVAELAAVSRGTANPEIAAIIAHTDLRQGAVLDEVLDCHQEAGQGLFRGIRHAGARHPYPEEAFIPGTAAEGLFADEQFRQGVRLLGKRGLTYESWHYHFQINDYRALAEACPETVMIHDHFGTPLGTKSYVGKREEIFDQWRRDIDGLAKCPNVFAKLGGLAMPDNGFGWNLAERPASSDDLVAEQGRYYWHTIEAFGSGRCMFESNFPVDKLSISYPVLWNAFKKIAARYGAEEKDELFYGTASRVYKI